MRLRKKKTLLEQPSDYVDAVRPQVEAAVAQARDVIGDLVEKAGPVIADAREKAGPALAEAREKAGVYATEAREKAAPVVATGVAYAAEKAALAKELADAKVAELTAEPPKKKKGGKARKVLVFGALAGLAAFAVAKLRGGSSSDNWQSSYVPTPPPGPANPTAPAGTTGGAAPAPEDDAGGASPDEAIADQAEEAHDVTTPDQPAEVVDLDKQRE